MIVTAAYIDYITIRWCLHNYSAWQSNTTNYYLHINNNPPTVSPHQTSTRVHKSNHKCSLHQANRVDNWELLEEEVKHMISSWSLLYSSCCYILNSSNSLFSLFYLPLQFIHLFDEVSRTFLFSNKLFLKHSLCRCLCSGGACRDTSILKKRVLSLTWEWT